MNQLTIIIIAAAGILLIYAAVKDKSPADIVRDTFAGGKGGANRAY